MKTAIIILTLLLTIATSCNCLTLPPGFKKCDVRRPDFDQCLGKAINDALEQLYRPLHNYDLPSLGIVNMPDTVLEWGDNVEGFRNKFSNFTFYGFTRPLSTKASMDFGTNTLIIEATFPEIEFDTFYEGHGSVVLLPVDVWTDYHVIWVKPTFRLVFKLEEYGKSTRYYRVVDLDVVVLTEEAVVIEFKDLFGDKALNDAFNAELTKHGVKINKILHPKQKSFAPYFINVFNNLLEKVPKHELFGGVN